MQLLLFVFLFVCFAFVEICCDNAKLSNRLCRFYVLCLLLLLVLPFVAGFARWKRKFSACDNIPIKNHTALPACFLRQTRAIKSTSKSEIWIVVKTGCGHPRLQSYSSIIYIDLMIFLVCGHDILIRVILFCDKNSSWAKSKSLCLKMDLHRVKVWPDALMWFCRFFSLE